MVRVIPVNNFGSQNIIQIEEPTASCVAMTIRGEFALLALPSHRVEVRDLKSDELDLVTSFPTVDLVRQIIHCGTGDYVATLESKTSRDGTNSVNFTRVYVNWSTVESQGHAMRARIAGRVTPSLNQPSNTLEMIELPLNGQPTLITCCQSTGNLLVATGSSAVLHEFKVETQQTTKLKFIDFEARPWSLGFPFVPKRIELVEDFVSLLDSRHFLAFQLTNPMYDDIDQLSSLESTNSSSASKTTSTSGNISTSVFTDRTDEDLTEGGSVNESSTKSETRENYDRNSNSNEKRRRSESRSNRGKINSQPYIDWERLIRDERGEMQRLVARGIVEANSQPFAINFPSISLERATPGHAVNPFVLNPSNVEVVIKTTSPDDGWSENYAVKSLLRIKIRSNVDKTDEGTDKFACLEIKPLYLNKECNNSCLKKSILRSNKFRYLHGITCVLCTSQEGYVYHFSPTNYQDSVVPACLTAYPFTAPVRDVALDDTVLHALTEAGLETYTMRVSHHVARSLALVDDHESACPAVSEPVSLVGLRPFIGVRKLLPTNNFLALLTGTQNSWALCSMSLPSVEQLCQNLFDTAKHHRDNSPSTYRHLLGEAHAIMRLSKETRSGSRNESNALDLLFRESCALLADYHLNSESPREWESSIPYYAMSKLKPSDVLARNRSYDAPGLARYLTETLIKLKSGPEADALFQNHNVVEILTNLNVEDLSRLVLGSSVLREYATDKLIGLLERRVDANLESRRLGLALLYLQSEKHDRARNVLASISNAFLSNTIREHWHLLFDSTALMKRSRAVPTFSDFSGALVQDKRTVFAEILVGLVEDDELTLRQVIRVFLEYLPSRVGRDGRDAAAALQLFIETYFDNYFGTRSRDTSWHSETELGHASATTEAFKILVRSYLGNLTRSNSYKSIDTSLNDANENEKDSGYLFAEHRPAYLNKLPPYDYNDSEKLFGNGENKGVTEPEGKTIRSEVPKLQALLASGHLPKECVREVRQFLDNQDDVEGSLAFKTLCVNDTEIVTRIIHARYPLATLQYAKDKYTNENEWKFLIRLLQDEISMFEDHQDSRRLFCSNRILTETLTHLAQTLPLEDLCRVLPKEDEAAYRRYTDACRRSGNADHVKSLIVETGHQLLTTLNL